MDSIWLMLYNWQMPSWPEFRFSMEKIESLLLEFLDCAGQLGGALKALPKGKETEAMLEVMLAEAINTSQIESEYLDRDDVMSSLRNRMGLEFLPRRAQDGAAKGVAELMVEVRERWSEPLSEDMLFYWHELLFEGTSSGRIGVWRTGDEPMQVVSGRIGRQRVHFEAPPSGRVADEMGQYIHWFNTVAPQALHPPVRAAVAHLYFESIHPFEDGNGRIGRALAEKALSQALGRPAVLSLSAVIERRKADYYRELSEAQQSVDVSNWVQFFAEVTLDAQRQALETVDFVLKQARFFDQFGSALSDRQRKVLRRVFEEGPDGFQGALNARKYASLTRTSKATATRDLQQLFEIGALEAIGSGRSRRYTPLI